MSYFNVKNYVMFVSMVERRFLKRHTFIKRKPRFSHLILDVLWLIIQRFFISQQQLLIYGIAS